MFTKSSPKYISCTVSTRCLVLHIQMLTLKSLKRYANHSVGWENSCHLTVIRIEVAHGADELVVCDVWVL